MSNFFSKLVDQGPQRAPACSSVTRAKTCSYRSGCGGPNWSKNAEYTYLRDSYGNDCGGYQYVSCGCYNQGYP